MGGLGSVVVAVLMMLLLVPGAGVGDIPTTSPTAWLTWLTREINFVAGFMVKVVLAGCFLVGLLVVGLLMVGFWAVGGFLAEGFLKVGELGADCVTVMSQVSLVFRQTVISSRESLIVTEPLLVNFTSSGDCFPFFSKKSLMSLIDFAGFTPLIALVAPGCGVLNITPLSES